MGRAARLNGKRYGKLSALAIVAVCFSLQAATGGLARPNRRAERSNRRPDLVERTVSTSVSTVAPGDSFKINDLVANRGHAKSRASTTRFFLGKVAIGVRHVAALKKGKTSRGSVSLVVPPGTADGAYPVRACADAGKKVTESNERNNCRVANRPVAVLAPVKPPLPPPKVLDSDGDGSLDNVDCAPKDPNIHPGAPDKPDLKFVDSNCDGIDGDKAKAIFVSPSGKDTNPGTMAKPKLTLNAAVIAAAAANKDVYAAAGGYGRVDLASGVGIYGSYGADWRRPATTTTTISGPGPEAALADGDTGVTIQLVTLSGNPLTGSGACAYGLRAINGSNVVLEQDAVSAGDARSGVDGAAGAAGAAGGNGTNGQDGDCDKAIATGQNVGAGGSSPAGRFGGRGGVGGQGPDSGVFAPDAQPGDRGGPGVVDTPGGAGGAGGDPGQSGGRGSFGLEGHDGANGPGGANDSSPPGPVWAGRSGSPGTNGEPGNGGGGGGGGGGQSCSFCDGGTGGAGGGGGGGGGGGIRGDGGSAGGGSFGIYLWNSTVTVTSQSVIRAGGGGAGGSGGTGGAPGGFGAGGNGGNGCVGEVGAGGNGGFGGPGGRGGAGGGGAGGPSIAVFKGGTSFLTVDASSGLVAGVPGPGGTSAAGSGGNGQAGVAALVFVP